MICHIVTILVLLNRSHVKQNMISEGNSAKKITYKVPEFDGYDHFFSNEQTLRENIT